MKKVLSIIFLTSSFAATTQTSTDENISPFSATINPSFYILGGYSIKGFYHLLKRWSFGMAAEASFELPDFARDQFFDNAEDLIIDWDYLLGLEARYRFQDGYLDRGFYILGTIGIEGWTVMDVDGAEDQFDNWYSSLGVGYNWYPLKKPNFHLGVSYNIVFILNNTDTRRVGPATYNINAVVPPNLAPTIFLGWRF